MAPQIPAFPGQPSRLDPYKNFKFKVKWDNDYVAGVSKVSGLKRTTNVVKHRDGGDPSTQRKSPGQTDYEPITLERGVTHDSAFEEWANLVWKLEGGFAAALSLKDFRKDQITIDFFDEGGNKVLAYIVHRCWVSEYQPLPDLDAGGNGVAIQHIKIEHEGWSRDTSVVPPTVGP